MKKALMICMAMTCLFQSHYVSAQSELNTADQYAMMGSYDRAIEIYVDALSTNPNDKLTTEKLIKIYQKKGDVQLIYKHLSMVNPSTLSNATILAQAHACKTLEKYDEAKVWYKAYRERDHFVAQHFYQSCDFAKNELNRPGLYDVALLNTNSTQSDYGPEFFNGKLIFASHRTDLKRQIKKSDQKLNKGKSQLYVSDIISDTELSQSVFLRDDLQNVFGEGPVSYSEDGRIAAIMKSDSKKEGSSLIDGDEKSLSIYLALTDAQGDWTLAEPFPFNSTSYSNAWPYLMNGGKTIYFASNKPGGYGGYDIYVSHRKKGEWTIPANLGAHVNSQGNEITPHFSNGNLFFASDWHFGFGGYDIFRAEIRNGDYACIYHLGKDINSPYNDYGLVTESDAQNGYFTSNRPNGIGAEDIYFCNKVSGQVEIVILDAHNQTPISGAMVKLDNYNDLLQTDRSGKCSINLPGDHSYSFEVLMEGYDDKAFSVTADPKSVNSKNYRINLEPKVVKAVLNQNSAINSSRLIETATHQLDRPATQSNMDQVKTDTTRRTTTKVTNDYANVQRTSNGTPLRRPVQTQTVHVNNSTPIVNETPVATNRVSPHRVSTTATTSNGTPLRRPVSTNTTIVDNSVLKATTPAELKEVDTSNRVHSNFNVSDLYSIQLASFHEVHTMNVEMKPFKRLYDLGGLYKSESGGVTKVKLGTFEQEHEARKALEEVKIRGFKDAFIIREQKTLPFDAKPKEAQIKPTSTSILDEANQEVISPSREIQKSTVMHTLSSGYKVRLAAYSDLSNFDQSLLTDLGYAEVQSNGPFSIIYLSGLANYDQARAALLKMRKRGFRDAYVVLNKNGVINKIQ